MVGSWRGLVLLCQKETKTELWLHSATGRARERRRRSIGASIARHAHGPLPDLLTVPGIGPRNMEKLVAKGIAKLAELKQLYRDKVSFTFPISQVVVFVSLPRL